MNRARRLRRKSNLLSRIAEGAVADQRCSVPGCGRPSAKAAGRGLSASLCRYHTQWLARHGSTHAPSFRASELRPHLRAATSWVREGREQPEIATALDRLAGLLAHAGPVIHAASIRRRSAGSRARVALARLREARVSPERLLAIRLAVGALILDDRDAPRTPEFLTVQVAKAAHRLASGTHGTYELPRPDGTIAMRRTHDYPRSTGLVLRALGEEIGAACGLVPEGGVEAVLARKAETASPHPSRLPGWKPRWQRARETALRAREATAAEADRAVGLLSLIRALR